MSMFSPSIFRERTYISSRMAMGRAVRSCGQPTEDSWCFITPRYVAPHVFLSTVGQSNRHRHFPLWAHSPVMVAVWLTLTTHRGRALIGVCNWPPQVEGCSLSRTSSFPPSTRTHRSWLPMATILSSAPGEQKKQRFGEQILMDETPCSLPKLLSRDGSAVPTGL